MRYFKESEFDCKCNCGKNEMNEDFMNRLDKAREYSATPYIINSGMRCPEHNKRVGGADTSSHLKGLAADIQAKDSRQRYEILIGLLAIGFNRLGIGSDFIHVDADESKLSRAVWVY